MAKILESYFYIQRKILKALHQIESLEILLVALVRASYTRGMKTYLCLTLALIFSSASFAQTRSTLQPSADNCLFYYQIENDMQCGPQGYFQKWATPMCEKYIRSDANPLTSLFLSNELKQWFPQVRLCLQEYLLSEISGLTCQNLNQHANQSHVECYVETGYCQLSAYAKLQLAGLSANAVLMDPVLWQQSALEISKICAGMGCH